MDADAYEAVQKLLPQRRRPPQRRSAMWDWRGFDSLSSEDYNLILQGLARPILALPPELKPMLVLDVERGGTTASDLAALLKIKHHSLTMRGDHVTPSSIAELIATKINLGLGPHDICPYVVNENHARSGKLVVECAQDLKKFGFMLVMVVVLVQQADLRDGYPTWGAKQKLSKLIMSGVGLHGVPLEAIANYGKNREITRGSLSTRQAATLATNQMVKRIELPNEVSSGGPEVTGRPIDAQYQGPEIGALKA